MLQEGADRGVEELDMSDRQRPPRRSVKKPVGLVGYGGVSGGLRAMQTIKVLMNTVQLMPLPQEVPIPFLFNFIGEDGTFAPAPEVTQGATGMLAELKVWAETLKPARAEQVKKAA